MAETSNSLRDWGSELPVDSRVIREMNAFGHDGAGLPEGYADALAKDVRYAIFAAARAAMQRVSAGDIAPFVEVTFAEPGFARRTRQKGGGDVVDLFEQGFVRTEGLAFYATDATPLEAMTLYTSRDFQMSVSSRIERLWDEDGLSCVEVRGVKGLLEPTMACNKTDKLVEEGIAAQHSQVVSNGGDDRYQRVFFKESLKTFMAIPGGMAVHYINYTRSARLGSIKRKLGKGKIRESQERRFEALGKAIVSDKD